ncbi:MAG: hypothetical protein GY874_18440 [Desulfobacteraceae bacterium]|nr:hypothetical protein [Desulfobacteraceae bacterium]
MDRISTAGKNIDPISTAGKNIDPISTAGKNIDPISTAIVATIKGEFNTPDNQDVFDAYNRLKNKIKSKFGEKNEIFKTIADLEKKIRSKGLPVVLTEQVKAANAQQESDIVEVAENLLDIIRQQPGGIASYMI